MAVTLANQSIAGLAVASLSIAGQPATPLAIGYIDTVSSGTIGPYAFDTIVDAWLYGAGGSSGSTVGGGGGGAAYKRARLLAGRTLVYTIAPPPSAPADAATTTLTLPTGISVIITGAKGGDGGGQPGTGSGGDINRTGGSAATGTGLAGEFGGTGGGPGGGAGGGAGFTDFGSLPVGNGGAAAAVGVGPGAGGGAGGSHAGQSGRIIAVIARA